MAGVAAAGDESSRPGRRSRREHDGRAGFRRRSSTRGGTPARYNALLAEAKRLLPEGTLCPHRHEAANLDVLMYAEQLADRLVDTDPAGDSGAWRR
jgi:hypothetical protein